MRGFEVQLSFIEALSGLFSVLFVLFLPLSCFLYYKKRRNMWEEWRARSRGKWIHGENERERKVFEGGRKAFTGYSNHGGKEEARRKREGRGGAGEGK